MTTVDYQQLFQHLLEAVPFPTFIIDQTLSVWMVNQPGLTLGQTTALHPTTKLDQIIPNPDVLHLVEQCVRTGKSQRKLYDREKTDTIWRVTVTPLTDATLYALVIEDMTEVRRLERVQQDFLANISHELRTPLTTVRLLAETLEDTIDTDPDQAQQFVEKIENEVEYLTGLVAELLELSRIESGQLPMTIEAVAADLLVYEVRARMLALAQRHRVRLGTDIQQGDKQVAADSKLITRVLVNLTHNAIKFTPSGGSIVIGTAFQEEKQMQSFFVRDTGVGISAEDLSRVFERFYKTNRSRVKADFIGPGGGGTGLGLAIAKQVVEAHNGCIMAESNVGAGSTFTFMLPLAPPKSSTSQNMSF